MAIDYQQYFVNPITRAHTGTIKRFQPFLLQQLFVKKTLDFYYILQYNTTGHFLGEKIKTHHPKK